MFKAGDQDPEIPLVEVDGNGAKVAPEQIEEIAEKLGVTSGLTGIVKV